MNLVAFFAISAAIVCSIRSFHLNSLEEDRIIGGETAKPGQFPYQVSLRQISKKNDTAPVRYLFRCGACLISIRWIISGADCTAHKSFSNASNMLIVVGAHHRANDGKMYRLDRIVNHPTFDWKNLRGDISLMRTIDKIQFNKAVQPIALRKGFVKEGVTTIFAGWGKFEDAGTDPLPKYLQFMRAKTITNIECFKRYEDVYPDYIYNGTLCTLGESHKSACAGDYGGPLVSNGQLIGVSSWTFPCARGRPEGFTRISTFTKWIYDVSGVAAV